MGTLLPADATRDKRSMLITQVAALEGWYRCQSLDIWRQTPCKDLLGRQPGHAGGSTILEARAVWSSLTPNSRVKAPDKTKGNKPTRPAHRNAVSQRPARRRLQDGCPWRRPPRQRHYWQHPRPRVCAFDGRAFNALEFTTRRPSALRSAPSPPGKRLRSLLYISTTPIHPLLGH